MVVVCGLQCNAAARVGLRFPAGGSVVPRAPPLTTPLCERKIRQRVPTFTHTYVRALLKPQDLPL